MPAIDVFWLNHSMAFLPDRGASLGSLPCLYTFTISPISQSRSVTLAAIAGVVRSVLWIARLLCSPLRAACGRTLDEACALAVRPRLRLDMPKRLRRANLHLSYSMTLSRLLDTMPKTDMTM